MTEAKFTTSRCIVLMEVYNNSDDNISQRIGLMDLRIKRSFFSAANKISLHMCCMLIVAPFCWLC